MMKKPELLKNLTTGFKSKALSGILGVLSLKLGPWILCPVAILYFFDGIVELLKSYDERINIRDTNRVMIDREKIINESLKLKQMRDED